MTVVIRNISDRAQWLSWREMNVNASEVACLFGAHPHLSAYKLWALRSGLLPEDRDTPEKKRGRLLEDDAIEILGEERPEWVCRRPNVYLADEEARLGATPDLYAYRDGALGVVQIKTSGHFAFAKNWRDPDTREVEVPLWIAVQAAVEAHLSGAEWAAVAVMTLGDGGLGLYVEDVPLKDLPGLIANAKANIAEFWRRVEARDPYPIDWNRDLETLLSVYRDDDGSLIDMTGDPEIEALLTERKLYKATEELGEHAKRQRRLADGRLIDAMGNAARMRFGGTLIEALTVRRRGYTVDATQFRQVKIKEARL